jgi:hypothetical protein
MADPRFLTGFVLVALVTMAVLVTLLAAGVSRPGSRRAGLIAGGLPLALLPPVLATAYIAAKLGGLFAAESGVAVDACASLWLLQRVAWGAFAVSCALGFVLGLLRRGDTADDVPCSVRRGLVLVLLPCLGLLVASTLTHRLGKAMRVTAAVLSSDRSDPAGRARTDAVLEAEGLATRSVGSIAALARFIARSTTLGTFGGVTAAVILLGLALPGFILAWRVRFGTSFLALASAVWLLAAAGGSLVSFGVLLPLRVP